MQVVADTSALVSLGTVAQHDPSPFDRLCAAHDLVLPELVIEELQETAAYDDASGDGASHILDRRGDFDLRSVDLDETFPLDDGENAAVTLANTIDATQLLCDEFNQLALIYASLVETRLVTTPTLLVAFVRNGIISETHAADLLTEISDARSWSGNTYVERARATLSRQ